MPIEVRIHHLDGDGEVVIPDAARLAEIFFSLDPSSRGEGSYDDLAPSDAPNEIRRDDLTPLNKSMRARTPEKWWEELFAAGELEWLLAVNTEWDLVEMNEDQFTQLEVTDRLHAAYLGTLGKGRRMSVGTKMLHFKRPQLVPVLDSLVVESLGSRETTSRRPATMASQCLELTLHLRSQGLLVRDELRGIKSYLAERGIERPPVRILDALLWSAHPSAAFHPLLAILPAWRADDAP